MIKFEHTEVVGWEAAIRGMRNPMNSWEKSDSHFGFGNVCCPDCAHTNDDICGQNCLDIGPNDLDLMMRLRSAGTDHRKFIRMIVVYVDITAPLYWWKEFDTYKVGTVANSCSTMHKIAAKEFTLEDFSCEHLEGRALNTLEDIVDELNYWREYYLSMNEQKVPHANKKAKEIWWQMIQLLPTSYNQRRTVMLNYEVLANMYKSRKDHKLDEWREFCQWIESLPYSEIITGMTESEKTLRIGEKLHEGFKDGLEHPDPAIIEKWNSILEQSHCVTFGTEDAVSIDNWPTACELCNANGHGDSDEEHCKKCQFYKYSKWAPDIIANAMAEAYGYPPIDPKKLDPAERTTDTAKAMKDIMGKLNKKE